MDGRQTCGNPFHRRRRHFFIFAPLVIVWFNQKRRLGAHPENRPVLGPFRFPVSPQSNNEKECPLGLKGRFPPEPALYVSVHLLNQQKISILPDAEEIAFISPYPSRRRLSFNHCSFFPIVFKCSFWMMPSIMSGTIKRPSFLLGDNRQFSRIF